MKNSEKLEIIVITILEPAQAEGMSMAEAERVYNALMKRYAALQRRQPKFADALLAEIERAITVARGGDGGAGRN